MINVKVDPDTLRARRAELAAAIGAAGLDAAVVCAAPSCLGAIVDSPGHLRFLTGWTPPFGPAAAVVRADGSTVVVAARPHDSRIFAERAHDRYETVEVGPGGAELAIAVARLAPGTPGKVAVAGLRECTAELARELSGRATSRFDLDALLYRLRVEHYAENEPLAAAAAHISDAMIDAVFTAADAETTLAELMAIAEYTGRSLGADTATCWLAGGRRADTTLFDTQELDWTLADGDRLQIGTTVRYEGFYGQSLRMAAAGDPPAGLVEHLARLDEIQTAALAGLRAGSSLHATHKTVQDLIDAACPYPTGADPFRFQACHGLGLSYSEPGLRAVSGASTPTGFEELEVADGMVVEVHPNYSVPDLGHVCLGDMALITEDGAAWLTNSPRTLHPLGW